MNIIIKDFMGNDLHVGDKVIISASTYSKTDFLKYGIITEISEPHYFKNGNLDYVSIKMKQLGRSDKYLSELEMNNYVHENNYTWKDKIYDTEFGFRYSSKCYINIFKVS